MWFDSWSQRYIENIVFSTIFCYLLLEFHVKTGTRFSLQDRRVFEISYVEITRVKCVCTFALILYKHRARALQILQCTKCLQFILNLPVTTAADETILYLYMYFFFFLFIYFSKKIKLDISCESTRQMILMKCQAISLKKKIFLECHLLQFWTALYGLLYKLICTSMKYGKPAVSIFSVSISFCRFSCHLASILVHYTQNM